MTEQDVELVRELRLRALLDAPYAFSATYEDLIERPMEMWRGRVASWARADDAETCFLAVEDCAAWAMCGVENCDTSRANLVALWVDASVRGLGVGGELVEAVCAFSSESGATEISAWVFEDNGGALRFYESVGFIVQAERKASKNAGETRQEVLTVRAL